MLILKEALYLFRKDLHLEWRSRYAFYGVLIYVVASVYITYLSFNQHQPPALVWNVIFWIIILFAAINAIARSFTQEGRGRQLYYYTIASAQAVILAKIIYNGVLMLVLSSVAWIVYRLFFGSPVQDELMYAIAVFLGSISFSTVFTLISSIASKANNSGTLMAILSFPLIVPVLLLLIKLSKNALDGLDRSVSGDEILVLGSLSVMITAVSFLLFPYLWRD
ncbi:MAG: heme exporter protein CcmB [Mucilaginibacter polytrichastri]|nr:heme exporter protein CcmB [Mucilaginibacter polytrichastri]